MGAAMPGPGGWPPGHAEEVARAGRLGGGREDPGKPATPICTFSVSCTAFPGVAWSRRNRRPMSRQTPESTQSNTARAPPGGTPGPPASLPGPRGVGAGGVCFHARVRRCFPPLLSPHAVIVFLTFCTKNRFGRLPNL